MLDRYHFRYSNRRVCPYNRILDGLSMQDWLSIYRTGGPSTAMKPRHQGPQYYRPYSEDLLWDKKIAALKRRRQLLLVLPLQLLPCCCCCPFLSLLLPLFNAAVPAPAATAAAAPASCPCCCCPIFNCCCPWCCCCCHFCPSSAADSPSSTAAAAFHVTTWLLQLLLLSLSLLSLSLLSVVVVLKLQHDNRQHPSFYFKFMIVDIPHELTPPDCKSLQSRDTPQCQITWHLTMADHVTLYNDRSRDIPHWQITLHPIDLEITWHPQNGEMRDSARPYFFAVWRQRYRSDTDRVQQTQPWV